jgi:hypothetical protein
LGGLHINRPTSKKKGKNLTMLVWQELVIIMFQTHKGMKKSVLEFRTSSRVPPSKLSSKTLKFINM